MKGIDIEDQEYLAQLTRYSLEEERFLTTGELIKASKKIRQKSIWNLLKVAPEKATELALRRIKDRGSNYKFFDDTTMPSRAIIREIENETELGKNAVIREINIIEANDSLLKDKGLLKK